MNFDRIRKKLENFWFYYKWYLLGGLLILAMLIIGVRSCTLKSNPDLYALFACETEPNALQSLEMETWLADLAEDINQDGEKKAQLLISASRDLWTGAGSAALLVQVNSGNAVLYIVSEDVYATLHTNGVLQELSAFESPYIDGDRYALTDSGALKEVADFDESGQKYYLALRKVEGTAHEGKELYKKQEMQAKRVLSQLIEQEEK